MVCILSRLITGNEVVGYRCVDDLSENLYDVSVDVFDSLFKTKYDAILNAMIQRRWISDEYMIKVPSKTQIGATDFITNYEKVSGEYVRELPIVQVSGLSEFFEAYAKAMLMPAGGKESAPDGLHFILTEINYISGEYDDTVTYSGRFLIKGKKGYDALHKIGALAFEVKRLMPDISDGSKVFKKGFITGTLGVSRKVLMSAKIPQLYISSGIHVTSKNLYTREYFDFRVNHPCTGVCYKDIKNYNTRIGSIAYGSSALHLYANWRNRMLKAPFIIQ